MSLRRAFLLGAATLASIAALVAIAAVLSGSFGETEGDIFATLATTFVAGSTAIAGVACLERGSRFWGPLGIVLACGGFVLWSSEIWSHHHDSSYWKLLWSTLIWTLAALLVTTTRLMTRSASVARTLFRGTAAATTGAAALVSAMALREDGDGWQVFAVLLILGVLGAILTPIIERFVVIPVDADTPRVRVLGVLEGAEVVAMRTRSRSRVVKLEGRDIALADDEIVVVRPV